MVYMVASILGAASAAPLSTRLGARRGYVLAGLLFLAGSGGCGPSPPMPRLLLARARVSGVGGVPAWLGPLVGGVFSEIGWWRGAFLFTLPIIAGFTLLAWRAI